MSVSSTARVWERSRSTGNARLVLLAIADHDGEGGAWPSVATLARMAGITPRNVQKHLETLVALGEIVVHKNAGGTLTTRAGQRPNRYQITLGQPVDNTPVATDTPVGSDTPTPVATDRGTPVGSDTRTTQGTTQGTTPQPPTVDNSAVPESLARLWTGEGINDQEQQALWALLVSDPTTIMPLHRGRQPAWILWGLAQVRAKTRTDTGVAVQQLRQYGPECEHGTPGGAATHPATGLPLCPLCRTLAARA